MAISKEELIKKINDWRKGSKEDNLSDAYLEYLDSILEKEGYDTFATDPDTGEELDDYTPEFEATQAEVLDDLGLSDEEIEMIMNGEWPNPDAVWPGTNQKVRSDSGITKPKGKDSSTYLNSISDGDGLDYYRYGPYTPEDEAKLNGNSEYKSLSEKITAGLTSGKPIEELRAEVGPLMSKRQKMAIDILHGSLSDKTPDDPDESSDKPHDEKLAGEKTPEEDFMQRAAEGKVPATSNILAGDLTPEEVEMIQMMRAKKQSQKNVGLAGEATPEENEMLNITNRLAKNLSKHRW